MIGMLWGASNILTTTSASRQWWWFITSDFWDQNPSQWNIKYALFGDGTPWSTAYTRVWNTSCVPTNVVVLSSLAGWSLANNTIYVVNSWTYTFTATLDIGDCSTLIGKGDVYIRPANASISTLITSINRNNIIIDNIKLDGQNLWVLWVDIDSSNNITVNNISAYNHDFGIWIYWSTATAVDNTRLFNNTNGWYSDTSSITINNSQFFNNTNGLRVDTIYNSTINNSQFFNNTNAIHAIAASLVLNNSIFFNNTVWYYGWATTWILNSVSLYNNTLWLKVENSWTVDYYGNIKIFNNTNLATITTWSIFHPWSTPLASRSAWGIENSPVTMDYDRVTNPQNGLGQWLLNGSNRSSLRDVLSFDPTQKPIRYVFWGNILKQISPLRYNWTTLEEFGIDGYDYSTTKYIAEPESTLSSPQQTIVNQYFWIWSAYTANRDTNWCSLSAFQIKVLNPTTFNTTYNFEDHTLYILTGGEYRSNVGWSTNGFVFNGNCIALIGTANTKFTKSGGGGLNSIFYANNKRNIIIDTIKIDGSYYNNSIYSLKTKYGIQFDGASNNNTFNSIQSYNNSQYGIYLGLSSHHNTIANSQIFNNLIAGIHLYYSSNYNVINNTQSYNNNGYGIWFANGSNRNTINNFQAYNNTVWIFWDLTTKENVINRSAIYNNSDVGIYLKNSSNNMFNDIRVYNNTIGIKALYSSQDNKYYGELKLFDNTWGNFDGTNGSDTYFTAGTAGLFPYAGTLSTWINMMSCMYVSKPVVSGSSLTLYPTTCTNKGYSSLFETPSMTYINYEFGLHMYKQKVPVRYTTGNNLIQLPSQYDANKYITEAFAIRDTTPESVNFISSGAAQLLTWYTTNVYTAAVINTQITGTLSFLPNTTSGYLIISGTNVWMTWVINNNDTLQISLLTRSGYNQTITGTLTLWSVTTVFTVTTRWVNQTPDTWSFAFANLTSISPNTITWSTVTVTWIETGVLASLHFLPTTTSGRLEIYSGTTFINSGTTWLLVYSWYQVRALAKSSSGYAQTVTWYVNIGLWTGVFTIITKWSDTVAPTTPLLTYPLTGEKMFFVTFEWIASTDTGSGIEWYVYEIAEDIWFIHIIDTWFIATVTGTIGSPSTNFDATQNKYYWRIKAQDRDGNYSTRSSTWYFRAIDLSDRDFTHKNNANLKTYYDSNEITLAGIKTGSSIWATLDGTWSIYLNWTNAWTGVLVKNDDVIYISLKSSTDYDDTISTLLNLANRSLEFSITTRQGSDSSCSLEDVDKETIQVIFDNIVSNYSGEDSKFEEFLYTMQSMLSDEIDFTNDCNLQYFQDLIDEKLGINGNENINTWSHIAPNCKEYPVSFDTARNAYTSPSFTLITFFVNRDSLTRYIDSKNPGDCHINTYWAASWMFTNTDPSRHIASNGKIYTLQYGSQWYSANEFSVKKYFNTLSELRNYIDSKNPPQAVRSHTVDTTFTPQTYTAPNMKTYTIYKTDRWYMSYKLMKVRYFSTLDEIQYFIKINNK